MKKLILFSLLFGGLFLSDILAQGGAPGIRVTFKTVGLGASQQNIFIRQNNAYIPIVIEADAVSTKATLYSGPEAMVLLRKVKTADKISYEPAGEVTFPPIPANEVGNFLLLFTGAANGQLTASAVPNDTTSFPAQMLRVINILPAPAGVMVNKDANLLKPGESRLFPLSSSKDNRTEIHIAVQHEGQWVEVNNNVYPAEKDVRRTVFLINRTPAHAPASQLPSIGFSCLIDRDNGKDAEAAKQAGNEAAL